MQIPILTETTDQQPTEESNYAFGGKIRGDVVGGGGGGGNISSHAMNPNMNWNNANIMLKDYCSKHY